MTDAQAAHDDASLNESTLPLRSFPAHPVKQITLGVCVVILAIAMFVPWWDSEIPLDRVSATLSGWQLIVAGLSIGSLGATTGYNWFGNVLFGLVPTIPALVVIVLVVLRVTRAVVFAASTLFVAALVAGVGALWLIVFGTVRIDASNGVYPVLAGPWIVLVIAAALCVATNVWWRTERFHFARPRRSGAARQAATVPGDDDASQPGTGTPAGGTGETGAGETGAGETGAAQRGAGAGGTGDTASFLGGLDDTQDDEVSLSESLGFAEPGDGGGADATGGGPDAEEPNRER